MRMRPRGCICRVASLEDFVPGAGQVCGNIARHVAVVVSGCLADRMRGAGWFALHCDAACLVVSGSLNDSV